MTDGLIRIGSLALAPYRQLTVNGQNVTLGRKSLAIISELARANGAIVTKDELLSAVWPGVVVEENALQVHVASLRKALGEEAGRLITARGIGYRLDLASGHAAGAAVSEMPKLAVLPFRTMGSPGAHAVIADALPHELIAQLSRLHWLFVIARGSSFQLRDPLIDLADVRQRLGARYCLSGMLEEAGDRIGITVELTDTRTGKVIWGEHYGATVHAIHELRSAIVSSVITALDFHISVHEARLAALNSSEQLDAWALYHLGLQRMFRFTRRDNEAAGALFEQAVARDPHFARAHAGLSFTHFQNAFMRYADHPSDEAIAAHRSAERALELDAADPFANLVFGRAKWVNGDLAGSIPWIDRALMLNPSYAQGAYSHALADAILCHGAESQRHADKAMALSPIDPMQYGMLGSRALSHAVRGEFGEAAHWSDRAAHAPNSHGLIAMIAVACHALAGMDDQARTWANAARRRAPRTAQTDFFRAFPFEKKEIRDNFADALGRFGF